MRRVLVINPGSTSTKLAVYDDEAQVVAATVRHAAADLAPRVADQALLRRAVVLAELARADVPLATLDAVVGRGGLCRPLPGGTYRVDAALLADLGGARYGEHASNLGGILADGLAREAAAARDSAATRAEPAQGAETAVSTHNRGVSALSSCLPAFVVDPVVVDELEPVARLSGHPEIERRSIFHALNQKAVARRYAAETGRRYDDLNLIVAHLGGGISVGAHRRGRVVDVNNALDGDGPFAPERAGGLPTASWVKFLLSGRYAPDEARRLLVGRGGWTSLLGTSDAREVDARAAAGDAAATLARDALAYQVAKEIGSCAAALRGRVDAVLLTGGLAHDSAIVAAITERVRFVADVAVYPGEDELPALRDGALRVLRGQEAARSYADVAAPPPNPVLVVTGHYGSGKTEFAVNLALAEAAAGRRVALADLDIVNPYFRSRERAALMEDAGVRVISSSLGHVTTLELPAISPEIRGPLTDAGVEVILDLGGDAVGAKILAQFGADVRRREHRLLLVVNANRPETATADAVLGYLRQIESVTGLAASGLVSNTHLLRETTTADVRAGIRLCADVTLASGVPLAYVSAIPDALTGLTRAERSDLDAAGVRLLPIGLYLRDEWM